MPALNFKKEFVPLIKKGFKKMTIRKDRKCPIMEGNKLYLYSGMRTANCEKIAEAKCTEVGCLGLTCKARWIL